jgi:hypothetical protein
MRIPLARALAVSTLSLLAAVPSLADTVYLTNGKSFDGVVAEVSDSQVRIQMPGGEIRLPKGSVERVEPRESAYAEYLQRKEALGRRAGAADWLALARWAGANGLDQASRESALRAAQLDPHLAGLSSILRGYGYVFDKDLDRYVSYADAMHRRGFVNSGGRWISHEEQAEMRRAREENQQRQAALQAAEAARAASEAQQQLAELELYQQQAAAPGDAGLAYSGAYPGYYSPYGFTLGVFPGFFPLVSRSHHGRGEGFHGSSGHGQGMGGGRGRGLGAGGGGLGRVPGSLLPAGPSARRR